jgi:hypothetical protein
MLDSVRWIVSKDRFCGQMWGDTLVLKGSLLNPMRWERERDRGCSRYDFNTIMEVANILFCVLVQKCMTEMQSYVRNPEFDPFENDLCGYRQVE